MATFHHFALEEFETTKSDASATTNDDRISLVREMSATTLKYDSTELKLGRFRLSVPRWVCRSGNLRQGTSLTTTKFCHSRTSPVRPDNKLAQTTYSAIEVSRIGVETFGTTVHYRIATILSTTTFC